MRVNYEAEQKRLKRVRLGNGMVLVACTISLLVFVCMFSYSYGGAIMDWQEIRTLKMESLKLDIEIKRKVLTKTE